MEQYASSVRDSAEKHLDKRYANSSLEHARLLTEELIKHSKKEVCMLSNSFHNGFYSSLKPTIESFLSKEDVTFKLITSDNDSNILQELKATFPKKFLTKVVSLEDFPTDKDSEEEVNFLINDTDGFRYEYSDKRIQDGLVEAVANFNSPEETNYLKTHFDSLFKQ